MMMTVSVLIILTMKTVQPLKKVTVTVTKLMEAKTKVNGPHFVLRIQTMLTASMKTVVTKAKVTKVTKAKVTTNGKHIVRRIQTMLTAWPMKEMTMSGGTTRPKKSSSMSEVHGTNTWKMKKSKP